MRRVGQLRFQLKSACSHKQYERFCESKASDVISRELHMIEPQQEILIPWLRQVVELERRSAVLDEAVAHGNVVLNELKKPVKVTREEVDATVYRARFHAPWDDEWVISVYMLVCLGFIVWVILDGGILWGIVGLFLAPFWPILELIALLGGIDDEPMIVLGLAMTFIIIGYLVRLAVEAVESDMAYEKARKRIEARNSGLEMRARAEAELRRARARELQIELDELLCTKETLSMTRDELYQTGGYLHDVYRGLFQVTYILELLESGRCLTLYGHGGAIDVLERDSQFSTLNAKLDVAINQLRNLQQSHCFMRMIMQKTSDEIRALNTEINTFKSDDDVFKARLLACETYRTQCLEYVMGQRISLPARGGY